MDGDDFDFMLMSKPALPAGFAHVRGPKSSLPAPYSSLFFVLAHLLREVAFVAQFSDLMHLGFEEVDVLFFILQQFHE